jgi:hypothetical protein
MKRFTALTAVVAALALIAALATAVVRDDDESAAATSEAQVAAPHDHPASPGQEDDAARRKPASPEALAFQDEMRRLWEDHITWTRLFIVSAIADLPDAGPTAERLLRNQADIGNAIKPFYGEEAGAQLTALLEEHILIAADILTAAKAGDTAATDGALELWKANGREIAAFLSAANPDAWPVAEMEAMMQAHLDRTLEEAVARLQGDWAADIAAYEQVHADILHMADMLSSGIIAQFPRQFR